ncbi:MAG: DUF1631 family protein [Chromatiales bacterium]
METNSDSPGRGTQSSFVEQRKSPRHPVYLDALITGQGVESKACKIRDFCASGVFLSFEEQAGAVAYASQQPIARDDLIGIHFFMELSGRDRSFELKARVVRVLTSGLGAELIQPDPVVIAALKHAAKLTAAPPGAVMLKAGESAEKGVSGREALLRELRDRLAAVCNAWMGQYFRAVQGQFLEAARDAPDAVVQRQIWNAAQFLNARRDKMEQDVRAALLERVDTAASKGVRESDTVTRSQGEDLAGELSLVETDEFEQFLAVSEVVDKAETMFTQSLFELHQRLSFLYGARIDKGNNPIGPAALAREFGNYVRRMQLGVEPLRLALRVYQDVVLPEVGSFYENINRFLRDNGVPLLGEPEGPRAKMVREIRRPRVASATPAAPASPAAPPQTPLVPGVAPPVPMPAGAVPPGFPAAGTPFAVPPAGAFRTAQALFGLGRELRAPVAMEAALAASLGPAASLAFYSTLELASALQAIDLSGGEGSGVIDPYSLRAGLEQALVAQAPAKTSKRVNDADWDVLELVVELVNAVLSDPRVHQEIRPHLRRLRHPVNMVALSDKAFFDSLDHPARKVINNLAGLRSLSGRDGQESILPRVEFMVDRIAAEAGARPGVFGEVAAELQVLLAEQDHAQAENLAQLAHAAKAQQQILKARRKEGAGAGRPAALAALGGEWTVWLNRAKRLKVGDELQLGTSGRQQLARVAWVADDGSSYVFADPMGRKVGSFGLQELAMQLRRGSAKVLEDLHMAPVERALLKSLENLHGRLQKQVVSDPQTSLLNERALGDAIEQALVRARQDKVSHTFALIAVEQVEALQSADKTDALAKVLREAATRLRGAVDAETTLAHLSDNHFGLLLCDCTQGQGYAAVERALKALGSAALPAAGVTTPLTASAGLVPFQGEALTAASVIKAAQSAVAVARRAGGNTLRILHVEAEGDHVDTVSARLKDKLAEALDTGTVQMAFQRIVPEQEGPAAALPVHIELMPSIHVEGARVNAKTLRIAAEQLQRSTDLDRWLIHAGMQWVIEHPERLPPQGLCIIPLSAASVRDAGTAGLISEAFINTAAPPSRFCFELTEGAAGDGLAEAEELVHALREFGCRFAYGDFGGESASFSRVKALQVDLVRIGRMQNRDIVNARSDAALVKSILEMAHFIGVPAIADCVSSKPVFSKARELGIEYLQGPAVAPVELAI